jgi:hypothetical protein
MMYGYDKLRILIIAGCLVVGCGSPNLSMAQGVNSLPDGPVACAAFQRGGHGSWTVLRPATIYPNGVPLSLAISTPAAAEAPTTLYRTSAG